jgi:cellulose synthase/poly-beta-1,6-N-acetylglucosamine synthase-like glycosyltransferase
MIIVEALLCMLTLATLLPVSVLLMQVLTALFARRASSAPAGRRPAIAVLVPAHDEASVIAETLRSINPQLGAGDRLLVVADNCSDATADLAIASGAEVVVRRDAERRGKTYALEFGIRHLDANPPDVVIVVDADCHLHDGAIDWLGRVCGEAVRPVQARYLLSTPAGADALPRVVDFACVVKNFVRPLGMSRHGLPCLLMGSGMAFPWAQIRAVTINHKHLAEDYKLGIDLALAGHPGVFCPEAVVTSYFPVNKVVEGVQRTRWEHGHLRLIQEEFVRLLHAAIHRRDPGLLGLALDLAVPPLALLVMASAAVFALNLTLFLTADVVWLWCLSTVQIGSLCFAVGVAWYAWGASVISLRSLLSLPYYVLAKIPLYVRFFVKPERTWIKTVRDPVVMVECDVKAPVQT